MNELITINIGGGGNPLNIIRIDTLNEIRIIISSADSDLNGNITPLDNNVWNFAGNHFWWSQNNITNSSYVTGTKSTATVLMTRFSVDKNMAYHPTQGFPHSFRPVIEYRI